MLPLLQDSQLHKAKEEEQQCSSPKGARQSSFKEVLSYLSELKDRVLNPRTSLGRAAAAAAAANAAAEQEQQQHAM